MKVCYKCKTEKIKSDFSKDSRAKDGLQSRCKSCYSSYYSENSGRIQKTVRAWQKNNPDKVAYYRSLNPEIAVERAVAWQKANPDRHNANSAAWQRANPEKRAASNHRRRAKERGAEGAHTAADVKAIFESQRGLCANCKKKLFKSGKKIFHADHIMPLALGGSNWPENIQCLCPTCNMRKGAKTPEEWARQNGKLF